MNTMLMLPHLGVLNLRLCSFRIIASLCVTQLSNKVLSVMSYLWGRMGDFT